MDDKMDCSAAPTSSAPPVFIDLMTPPPQTAVPRNDGLSGSSNMMDDRTPSDNNVNAATLATMASGTTASMSDHIHAVFTGSGGWRLGSRCG